jgi:glycosyltransferase involved in cell wall biosynthesis
VGADAEASVTQAKTGSRPIRVLHLRDSPWVDGPGRTILETAKRIDRSRVDYHVGAFVVEPGATHPLVEALRARSLPVHPIADRGGVGRAMVDGLLELIDALQVDVLHTSEFRSNVLALLCRRQRRGLRIVSTAHGWIANDLRGEVYCLADRVLLKRFDRVILVSHAMRRRIPAWWVADRKVCVLHNALVTDSYGREVLDRAKRVTDPRGEVRLLNVGRLSPEKGQALLLEAVSRLLPDYPGLVVWFAGTGPLQGKLEAEARRLGLDGRVRFLGYVADMPALYADVDLVVQSSLTEGLPNVMLEVAYLGVPVVATDVGGTAEVIEHGVSGWLVPKGSVRALEDGLWAFLRKPAVHVGMAARGRSRIESEFEFGHRTERQMRLYEEVACAVR